MELAEFQDKDEGKIQQAYNKDDEIQAIKKNLEKGVKEIKGIALGLCEWKDEHFWYQGKIWIPNDKELMAFSLALFGSQRFFFTIANAACSLCT